MMEFRDVMPIGTVVLLKEATKKLMIIGYKPIAEETDAVYDYVGVLFPEGFLGGETSILFNHDDINDVIYLGYTNPESEEFHVAISSLYTDEEIKSDE